MEQPNKKKRKLKLRNFLFLCLFFFLFCGFCFYLYELPIKRIVIIGNQLVSDYEIIETAGIKNYPSIFRTSSRKMMQSLKELDAIETVKIRKNILGTITFQIKEEVPLFYYRNRERLVFASGKEIISQELNGVPILINYVPSDLFERLLKEMKETDQNVLKLISEIEYQPWKSEDVVIDDTRFFLRMNDGNVVYVNLINFDKLNNYMTVYSTLGDKPGTLQLDSSLGNGITFTPF